MSRLRRAATLEPRRRQVQADVSPTSDVISPATVDAPPVYEPRDAPRARERDKSRMSILFAPDGSFDFARMQKSKRERLVSALKHPTTAQHLGDTETSSGIGAAGAPAVLFALSSIQQLALRNFGRVPAEQAKALATFSADEIAVLTPPIQRLLDKYLASSLDKYSDEAAFLLAFAGITFAKIQAAHAQPSAASKPADVLNFPPAADGQ